MTEVEDTARSSVLLFRAPKEGGIDSYDSELSKHGFETHSIPVLGFNFINIDKLTTSLQDTENYCAVVFTSQRAVEACEIALQNEDSNKKIIQEKRQRLSTSLPCYVVGESTGKMARECGFNPIGEDAGNAEKLAELIIEELNDTEKAILYPCGNLRKDTLSLKLKQAGFTLNEIEVYETIRNKEINSRVKDYIDKKGTPEYVVYFSPSGVQCTENLISSNILPVKSLKVVAIGPTTEKELIKQHIPCYGVARKPDPNGVLEVLTKDDIKK
ncbi:uroporphyrinogen-III synthase [Mactra antiquata]